METLSFSLDRKEIQIQFSKDGGIVKKYFLRELDGKDRDKYLTQSSKNIIIDKNGKGRLSTFDGMMSRLLCLSLFNEDGEAVSEEEIQSFPSSVSSALFEKAQEISGLDNENDKAKKEAKNV